MSAEQEAKFTIKAYRLKELITFYDVTYKTFRIWLGGVPDLGKCHGKAFTPAQVEKIVNHLGEPWK